MMSEQHLQRLLQELEVNSSFFSLQGDVIPLPPNGESATSLFINCFCRLDCLSKDKQEVLTICRDEAERIGKLLGKGDWLAVNQCCITVYCIRRNGERFRLYRMATSMDRIRKLSQNKLANIEPSEESEDDAIRELIASSR